MEYERASPVNIKVSSWLPLACEAISITAGRPLRSAIRSQRHHQRRTHSGAQTGTHPSHGRQIEST